MENSINKERIVVTKKKKKRLNGYITVLSVLVTLGLLILGPLGPKFEKTFVKAQITKGRSLFNNKCITKNEIVDYINNSSLKSEEKEYLLNSNFIDDYIEIINEKKNDCDWLYEGLENLSIGESENPDSNVLGYVHLEEPGRIKIRNYNNLSMTEVKMILPHEFIHVFQDQLSISCSFISEAACELSAAEYYRNGRIISYSDEIESLRAIMEIIGTHPIKVLAYTGDSKELIKELSKYLSDQDVAKMVYHMTINLSGKDRSKNREIIDKYIIKIYEKYYNVKLKENEYIYDLNSEFISKYYFNESLIEKQNENILKK